MYYQSGSLWRPSPLHADSNNLNNQRTRVHCPLNRSTLLTHKGAYEEQVYTGWSLPLVWKIWPINTPETAIWSKRCCEWCPFAALECQSRVVRKINKLSIVSSRREVRRTRSTLKWHPFGWRNKQKTEHLLFIVGCVQRSNVIIMLRLFWEVNKLLVR